MITDRILQQFGLKLVSIGSELWRDTMKNPNSPLYKSPEKPNTYGLKEWQVLTSPSESELQSTR